MSEKPKYPWLLAGVFLLIYLFTAAYPNSNPPLPGMLPFGLADAVLAPRFLAVAVANIILLSFYLFRKGNRQSRFSYCSVLLLLSLSSLTYFAFAPIAINVEEAFFKAIFELQFLLFLLSLVLIISNVSSPLLYLAEALLPLSLIHLGILSLQFGYAIDQVGFDHSISYKLTAIMGHRNLAAQLSFLLIPFQFYLFLKNKNTLFRVFSALLIAALCFFSLISLSRAVWLAFMGTGFVITFMFLLKIKRWLKKPSRMLRLAGIIAILIVVAVGFGMRSSMPETIKKQLHFLENPHYGSASERLKLWKFSLEEMKQHPVKGIGGNNWRIMAMKHDVSSIRQDSQQGAQVFFQRPHNDFIWKYCETGLIGLLFFVLVFGLSFFTLIRNYFRMKEKSNSLIILVLLSLFTGFFIFSFFSFPDERPMLKLLFIASLSLLVVSNGRKTSAGRLLPVIFLALQLLILPSAWLKLDSAKHNHLMQQARINQKYHKVITQSQESVNFLSSLDDVATPFDYYTAEAYLLKGETQKAERKFLSAYHANPHHPYILKSLGQVNCDKQRYLLAQKYFLQALENYPTFDLCRMQFANCLDKMNNLYAAIDQLRQLKDSAWMKTSKPMLKRWLPAACWKTAQTVNNNELSQVLLRMEQNPQWLQNIYQKSRENNINYRDQLVLDAIFLLISEGNINDTDAAILRKKHLSKDYLRHIKK